MNRSICAAVCVVFLTLCGASSGWAQSTELRFSGDLGVDAVFAPAPPFFASAEFELNLSVALLDVEFANETHFNLDGLRRQAFILKASVGQLFVDNELKFGPKLAFDRDKFVAQLRLDHVEIGSMLLVENITPTQSPALRMGLIFHFAWQANEHVRLFSDTAFGVSQISEDLDHDQDKELDLNVLNTFEFSEAVIGSRVIFEPLFLETKTIFTKLGFSKQTFTSGLHFERPALLLSNTLTIDSSFLISRIELNATNTIESLTWQSTTFIEGGGPFFLTLQEFQVFITVFEGIRLKAQSKFDETGVIEVRFGLWMSF